MIMRQETICVKNVDLQTALAVLDKNVNSYLESGWKLLEGGFQILLEKGQFCIVQVLIKE